MWLAPIAQLLALSAMAPAAETALPAPVQALPEPIATRQTLFGIPFRIDPAEQSGREPAEVQLFVSGDRGASWQLYSKVEPARRRFMFRAGGDGEFWFLARTIDRAGQFWPQRPEGPEMRVIVDTMPPKLQLQAERGQAGQITAHWTIDDPHPKPSSLTLQYRTTTDGPWQEVAVDRTQQQAASGSPQTGQVTWWPQTDSQEIQIRAEVSDLAGNLAVNHAQVKVGQGPEGPSPLVAQEDPQSAWRAAAGGPSATAWPAAQAAGDLAATAAGGLGGNPAATTDGQGNRTHAQAGAATSGPGNVQVSGAPAPSGTTGYADAANANDPSRNDRYANYRYPDTGAPPPTYLNTPTDTPSSLDDRGRLEPPPGSLSSSVNPPIQNRYVPPGESGGNPAESGLPPHPTDLRSVPDTQRPRMVNSRAFQLEYDVTSVGPSGISRVELWGTQDGGRSWRPLAVDDDNRSPLLVKVDQEGTYGLKVVVTSGTGLGARGWLGSSEASPQLPARPQAGELPEIVVGVDLTKPTARITDARPGTGAESGKLIISWQAHDQWLAARPVSLLFSERPGGPWTTIASGLENTGRCGWTIDQRAPQGIYLRLEVRDEAGNVGLFETPQPIPLGQFRPTAQIRDIRPTVDSGQTPARRYYLPPGIPQGGIGLQ